MRGTVGTSDVDLGRRNEVRNLTAALEPLLLAHWRGDIDDRELQAAEPDLLELLRIVQETLAPLAGDRVHGRERRELAGAHWNAVHLLSARVGRGRAKQLMAEAAGGRTLAICVGHGNVDFDPTLAGATSAASPDGDGCGLVFEEPASPAPFAIYCPTCREKRGRGRAARAGVLAFEAGMEELAPGQWWGVCSCGREFVGDVRQRRCDHCRRQHRTA